jgi:hypothetical protein
LPASTNTIGAAGATTDPRLFGASEPYHSGANLIEPPGTARPLEVSIREGAKKAKNADDTL